MPDIKITELAQAASLAAEDLFPVVQDVGGNRVTKKASALQVGDEIINNLLFASDLETEAKTISGAINELKAGGGGGGGTSNYNLLTNKPKINDVELAGDISSSDLNIDYNGLTNKPKINGVELAGDINSSSLNLDYSGLTNKPKINGVTLSGDISLDYSGLTNKPKINGVELTGDISSSSLNINYNDLTNKPVVPDIQTVFDRVYPVGSIYISINVTNPSAYFGGTWEAFGAGKTLVGVDADDSDFDVPEKTGGEKTHTLTIEEMPAHNHTIIKPRWSTQAGANAVYGSNGTGSGANRDADAIQGGGEAHNNLQPYITTYFWKRTA